MKMSRCFIGIAFVVLLLTGCRSSKSTLAHVARAVADSLDSEENAASTQDPILARLGHGVAIHEAEFKSYIQQFSPQNQERLLSPANRSNTLKNFADSKIITMLAHQSGIDHSEAYLSKTRPFEENLLNTLYLDQLRASVNVSSAEIRAFYDANPEAYSEGMVQANYIISKTMDGIQQAQKLLMAGKTFPEVSRLLAGDPTSQIIGGKLPSLVSRIQEPLIRKTAIRLHKGEVSDILQAEGGYELIRKNEESKISREPFEKVQAVIRETLETQKWTSMMNNLKSSIPLKIDEKALQNIQFSPPSSKPQ